MDNVFDQIVVIKLGGSIYNSRDIVITDLIELQRMGILPVIIHGGASLVSSWLLRQNHQTTFVNGERITDELALDTVTAVLSGLVNKEIVAAIINAGGKAAGISGVDGGLVQGKARDVQSGYLGTVVKVDTEIVMHLLTKGYIPVIAPVSLYCFEKDPAQRSLLNINGDTVAGALAANLKAKQMVFLTDVDGIKGENGNLLVDISVAEARKLIENGTAIGGMVPKLKACLEAVSNCITTCSIVNGNIKHILLREITAGHSGTTIQPESVI